MTVLKRANICCGSDVRYGWDNFDKFPVDDRVKFLDIDVLPFDIPDDTYGEVVICHGLEHSKLNKLDVVSELRRITVSGGRIFFELPIFGSMVCHTSFYHPSTYFDAVSKRDSGANFNYIGNWFNPVHVCYVGKRSLRRCLYWMKVRFLNWLRSFFYDSIEFCFEVK